MKKIVRIDQNKDKIPHRGDEKLPPHDPDDHGNDGVVTDEEWMERVHRIGDTCCADE